MPEMCAKATQVRWALPPHAHCMLPCMKYVLPLLNEGELRVVGVCAGGMGARSKERKGRRMESYHTRPWYGEHLQRIRRYDMSWGWSIALLTKLPPHRTPPSGGHAMGASETI